MGGIEWTGQPQLYLWFRLFKKDIFVLCFSDDKSGLKSHQYRNASQRNWSPL